MKKGYYIVSDNSVYNIEVLRERRDSLSKRIRGIHEISNMSREDLEKEMLDLDYQMEATEKEIEMLESYLEDIYQF